MKNNLLDALMTPTKHFVKSPHHCPKQSLLNVLAISHTKRIVWNSSIWCNKFYQWVLRRLYFRQKFIKQIFILTKNLCEDNDSIMKDRGFTIDKKLKPLNMRLSIPLFLYWQIQLLKDEATEGQSTDNT